MSLKSVIKNAFLGLIYSLDERSFENSLVRDDLTVQQLEMMKNLMLEQKEKMDKFIIIIDKIKQKKNE